MYLGRVVEIGSTEEIFADPKHPYTRALLGAIPDPDPHRIVVRDLPRGEIPDAANPPLGCAFHPRCRFATQHCAVGSPPALMELPTGRLHACLNADEVMNDAR